MHGLFLLARGPLYMDGPSFEERGADGAAPSTYDPEWQIEFGAPRWTADATS